MSEIPIKVLLISLAVICVQGNVIQWEDSLHPVQGLFVKPSADGTTGDLYVAASEDNGINTQWVADQPINFLPQNQPSAVASSINANEDGAATQKRAVFNSQPKYHAPQGSPYQYSPDNQQYYDSRMAYFYHYFYPYIMSAAASTAAHALKESGLSEEMTKAILSRSNLYTQYSQYPGYVADATAWAQSQTQPVAPTPTTPLATPVTVVTPASPSSQTSSETSNDTL